ncbi:SRPBCC domain-containing protein [Streptomyces sp. NBC_00564]|uniref:SRPBCC family protein n=1 Tax=Streptomyces sp. NBC_00564 TaxID=2903663 RepID=UPI00352D9F6F|nr:SRPBCC domain-containing protein [Streptomyces sp. NBC_00564]
MDFTNEFRVNLPADQAWALLTDVERIAPCMPGAQLTGVDGDAYNGLVKVKVGPMTVQYKGVVSFEEKDDAGRTAVLHARGRDTRGQGNADARVTARLTPDGDGTRVTVDTRLTITGKIAQFGKGMIEEVSGKLLTQFVDNLEGQLAAEKQEPLPEVEAKPESGPESGSGASAETAPAAPASEGVRPTEAPSVPRPSATAAPEPLDLMSVARGALLKRALPAVIVIAVIVIVLVVWLTAG